MLYNGDFTLINTSCRKSFVSKLGEYISSPLPNKEL